VFWQSSKAGHVAPQSPYWRGLQRAHIAFNLISNFMLGNFQVIARLEIHPERRTVVEVARETQGCVSSNCAFQVALSAIRVTGTRKSIATLFILSPMG
jgi:hypothetical protein